MKHDGLRNVSRRQFLAQTAAITAGTLVFDRSLHAAFAAAEAARPRIACVFTTCTFRSHAHVILENFLGSYLFRGKLTKPGCDVVSLYADQMPDGELARGISERFNIPLFASIDESLCLGGKELAVDGVLVIGEHGEYPHNDLGQHLYPRKQFFDAAVATMKRSGRFVPLFNDKHLSYRWDWAREMYDTSRELGFPLMAGSSVPLAERRPMIELPESAEIEEAVSIHGGGMESYGFHGLEVLQSVVEARKGGETGVSRIEQLSGDAVMQAARAGRWSRELADRALQAELAIRPQLPRGTLGEGAYTPAEALLLTYADGLRAAVLKVGDDSSRWNFACKLRNANEPLAAAFDNGPWQNRCLFKALSHAIQQFFVNRKAPYPVERTLLTTGILDAAMHSHADGGKPLDTPHLEFAYAPIDFRAMRETGASWEILPRDTPEPQGFEPGDERWLKKP